MPKTETIVYLHRLPESMRDDGELVRVYTHEHSGPRDQLRLPDWAPDSSKVVFAVFEQSSGHVQVLEADFPPPPPQEEEEGEQGGSWDELVARAKGEQEQQKDEDEDEQEEDDKQDEEGDLWLEERHVLRH